MVRNRFRLNIPYGYFLLACCFFMVFSARAEPYPQDFAFKGLYKVTFSGMLFGKIGLGFSQDSSGYEATTDVVSAGLLKLFTKHSSHSTVQATGADFIYDHIAYVSDYKTKNKKRHVEVTYLNGQFKEETLVPPENPAKRPPVEEELKNNSVDPISALVQARNKLRLALAAGQQHFSVHVYDGRRLSRADFSIAGKEVIKIYGVKYPVIRVEARRKLLAGYTSSELEDYNPNEPTLVMYFSNNAALFPVRLELDIYMGQLRADLFKRCAAHESCLLGNRD